METTLKDLAEWGLLLADWGLLAVQAGSLRRAPRRAGLRGGLRKAVAR